MWHEARKQEKLLRARIVDCSRRAEQRRKYYENVRKDPDQFMQLHGRGCTIHADKSIAKAAEEQNILRKWQGDPEILIDRFDARSHLDYIPPPRTTRIDEKSAIAKEETVCDFERYRLLIINEFKDVSEKTYLRKIGEKEFWLTSNNEDYRKLEMEKKKKSGEGKASIGFSYNDSDVVRGSMNEESEEEIDDEVQDIDVDLDLSKYTADSQRRANKIGEDYGIKLARFTGLLAADQHASREAAELKRIERQKSMLAGREGKQGRQILKRQRAMIVGKGVNDEATLSFKFREKAYEDKNKYLKQESSSSDSSDDEPAKAEFITTFGGGADKDDDEEEELVKPGSAEPAEKMDPACMKMLQFATGEPTTSLDMDGQTPPVRKVSKPRVNRSRSPSMSRRSRTASPPCRPGGSPSPVREDDSTGVPSDDTGLEEKKVASDSPESSDYGSDLELVEIRSSMSDSEKERIQIENRKRRVKRTKRMMKEKKPDRQDDESEEEEKKEIARKLKARLKKTLRQTVDEMREEEEAKKREAEKEKRIRDEIIFIEEQERKQREKKRREGSDRRKSSRSSSRSSRKSALVETEQGQDLVLVLGIVYEVGHVTDDPGAEAEAAVDIISIEEVEITNTSINRERHRARHRYAHR
ncbi:unnamed protein product [Auanema sp. JU1783]|nr:unnamed protein product [Auanema sp. JU1783]